MSTSGLISQLTGRQALRAHGRKHKNEDRAWRRPLVGQGIVAGFIVALAVPGLMGSADLKADVQSALPFGVPLVTLPELVVGWGTAAVAVALLLSSLYMLAAPARRVRWSVAGPGSIGAEGHWEPAVRLGCRRCLGSRQP